MIRWIRIICGKSVSGPYKTAFGSTTKVLGACHCPHPERRLTDCIYVLEIWNFLQPERASYHSRTRTYQRNNHRPVRLMLAVSCVMLQRGLAQLDGHVSWLRGPAGLPRKQLFRAIFPAPGSSRTSSLPDPSLPGSSVHGSLNVLPHSGLLPD
jgi:hypothetical protein